MPERTVDVAILGAGTAGLNARRAAKAQGASVLVADPGPLGTTCARVGCMPSKLLIAAADAAHDAREAHRFGVHAGPVRVDGPAVMRRVQAERDRFVGFVLDGTKAAEDAGELLRARARLVGPTTVQIGDDLHVEARAVVIATGSRPFVPPPYRALDDLLLTTDAVFELPDLPESLLVVGLGVIGLELGQAFARLGVRTTMLGLAGEVAQLRDPAVLAEARRVLGGELDAHFDHRLLSVERVAGGARVRFVGDDGREREGTFARVLVAAGRRRNVDGIGLEAAGLDPAKLPPWDPATARLGDTALFLAGDVAGHRPLLHEASDEGHIAGTNAGRFPRVAPMHRRTPLSVAFTHPQIAEVGLSHRELDPGRTCAGVVSFADQGRARVGLRNAGLVRIYGERGSGRLLGASMLGPDVEHLAHLLAWAVQRGLTVQEALAMPVYHPVVEEGLRTALRELAKALEKAPPEGEPCPGLFPGDEPAG